MCAKTVVVSGVDRLIPVNSDSDSDPLGVATSRDLLFIVPYSSRYLRYACSTRRHARGASERGRPARARARDGSAEPAHFDLVLQSTALCEATQGQAAYQVPLRYHVV